MHAQAQREAAKALATDPSVYAYDEVYEELAPAKAARDPRAVRARADTRQPRYIQALLDATQKRKMEDEIRNERKLKRELEEAGDALASGEMFLTNAYKQKLLELQQYREEEARKEAAEKRHDVTKQKDLRGFYANLLSHNVAFGAATEDHSAAPAPTSELPHRSPPSSADVARTAQPPSPPRPPLSPTPPPPQQQPRSPTPSVHSEPAPAAATVISGTTAPPQKPQTGPTIRRHTEQELDAARKRAAARLAARAPPH